MLFENSALHMFYAFGKGMVIAMNILFVCTGNTCRSPMAEGIMKKILPEHNISSAGIHTVDGLSASKEAIKVSEEIDVDISSHKSRQITREMAENSDLILCMTNSHKLMIGGVKSKVFTLGEFAEVFDEIGDPFGGSIDEYRACRDSIQQLLYKISERIQNENNTF